MLDPSPTLFSDLAVEPVSDSLSGKTIDLVVCGSIGAIESPKIIRSLRRLGAEVFATLSRSSMQFTTVAANEWASGKAVRTDFSGLESHIATRDFCLVAPATALMLHKISSGIVDTPGSALIASYLGQKKKVILLPAMHSSLADSPAVKSNLEKIASWPCVSILSPRCEEGKMKVPAPEALADHVAFLVNSFASKKQQAEVLMCMGPTRSYLDEVRFVSNISSGALGSLINRELYRRGAKLTTVAGPSFVKPEYGQILFVETNAEMESAMLAHLTAQSCLVFCAAILDFAVEQKELGKVTSKKQDWALNLKPTAKIIDKINARSGVKIGFKLETSLDVSVDILRRDYLEKKNLSLLILNKTSSLSLEGHEALVIPKIGETFKVSGKQAIASSVVQHIYNFSN